MTRPTYIGLAQSRGDWRASPTTATARKILGEGPIPVVRDWADGKLSWTERTYRETRGELSEGKDWWQEPQHVRWRKLLSESEFVWVRKAKEGETTGSVGKSKGVWRIANLSVDEDGLSFRLGEMVADVKT